MNPKKFLNSFKVATRGIILAVSKERNMKIHLIFAVVVIILSFILNISYPDFFILLLLIAIVFCTEMLNTAIEGICNILRDKYKLPYKASTDIRDISAGAVWFNALIAAFIGILIFSKYIF